MGPAGVSWEPPFLDAVAESYGTGLRQTDFVNDTEGSRRGINEWTSEQTHERISELIARGILDMDTRLVLVNAIYLKAPWAVPFTKVSTADGTFTCADGSTVQVPMMRSDTQSPLAYARGPGWQAVDLLYDGGGLAMAVVVPDAGRTDELIHGFDAELWAGVLAGMEPTRIDLRLPRWTVRTNEVLNPVLAGLGMPTAFTDRADFTGMTRDEPLQIAAVVHEAFVAVDEAGTEAAAATAVSIRALSFTPAPSSSRSTGRSCSCCTTPRQAHPCSSAG